jgi:hypothetical protein
MLRKRTITLCNLALVGRSCSGSMHYLHSHIVGTVTKATFVIWHLYFKYTVAAKNVGLKLLRLS